MIPMHTYQNSENAMPAKEQKFINHICRNKVTMRIVECIPNISEGRDKDKIHRIASVVEQVHGVMLLDVDAGASTNRTVITFAGTPEAVEEAAFLLIREAAMHIDMRSHKGEHPRQGATDVCPFVPVSGVSMEECVAMAHRLGERVGRELHIPGYYYENAAHSEDRRNLANCRKGEYEAIEKISSADWRPDFGPCAVDDNVRKCGITTIGAREFLVAYNINLNTTSTRRANAIAFDIREAGRVINDDKTGKPKLDENGEPMRIPGTLKSVKGIGWYIDEYGIAQLSLNLTNIDVTPVHVAFEEARIKADARGIRVTGSELVGLIPLKSMIDAADFFLCKQQRSLGISEKEKIKIAVKSLGLDDLAPFRPEEKIIEYIIADRLKNGGRLIGMDLKTFADETASESPAPGGGSVSAYAGAMAASLAAMVANLSAHKRGWDDRWEFFSDHAVKAMNCQRELLRLVDADTDAFNQIMQAYSLPKNTDIEKKLRSEAIERASKIAMEIPLRTAEIALESFDVIQAMVEHGNPNSITDAGVGALLARAAVLGAVMNVQVNASGIKDKAFTERLLRRAAELEKQAEAKETGIRSRVSQTIGS